MRKKTPTVVMTVDTKPSRAPFDWNELLAEMEKAAPVGGGTGYIIGEIAGILNTTSAKASKMIRQAMLAGKVERVREIRETLTGVQRQTTVFRVKK